MLQAIRVFANPEENKSLFGKTSTKLSSLERMYSIWEIQRYFVLDKGYNILYFILQDWLFSCHNWYFCLWCDWNNYFIKCKETELQRHKISNYFKFRFYVMVQKLKFKILPIQNFRDFEVPDYCFWWPNFRFMFWVFHTNTRFQKIKKKLSTFGSVQRGHF